MCLSYPKPWDGAGEVRGVKFYAKNGRGKIFDTLAGQEERGTGVWLVDESPVIINKGRRTYVSGWHIHHKPSDAFHNWHKHFVVLEKTDIIHAVRARFIRLQEDDGSVIVADEIYIEPEPITYEQALEILQANESE